MRSILFLYHYYLESILSLFQLSILAYTIAIQSLYYHFSITFLAIYTIAIQSDILEYTKNAPLLFSVYTITLSITFLAIIYQHMLLLISVYTIIVQSSGSISILLPLQISSNGLWHCISRLYRIVFYVIAFFLFYYILCLVFSVVFICILDARICQYAIYSLLFYNMNLL